MCSGGSGSDPEDVCWEDGRTVGGVAIGVIQMGPVRIPMMPGNMGNGTTFPFALLWQRMRGVATPAMVVSQEPHPQVLEWAIEAGQELQRQGCRAVVGNCGYLANYQPQVAAALEIPVFLSSLLQVPSILGSIKPFQKIGIICANGEVLSGGPCLQNCGVGDTSRVVIVGAEHTPQMRNVLEETGRLNSALFREELTALAVEMIQRRPEVAAILLECTEFPPYAWAVQKATGRPVFDFTTLANWVYSGVIRRPFSGFV